MKKIFYVITLALFSSSCTHGVSVTIGNGGVGCQETNNRYAPPRPQYRYSPQLGWYVDGPSCRGNRQ